MAAETLAPAPRSRREKIYEALSWLNGNFALMGSTLMGRESGFWPSILAAIVLTLPGTLFFAGLALRERNARLAGDLERGLIECAIRRPDALPGSLQGRWKPGYAQVQNGTIRFQTLYAGMDEPYGPISTFTGLGRLKPVPMPETRPPDLKRRWKIVGMTTDKGALELASEEASLRLLETRRG
jgi:hypothetical protein